MIDAAASRPVGAADGDGLGDALFARSPLPTQVFAADGSTVAVNRAWETLWGRTLDDLHGYVVFDDPRYRAPGAADLLRRAFAGEAVAIPPTAVAVETGPDAGARRWVRANAVPVRDEAGAVDRVAVIQEDVTEEVESRRHLEHIQTLLEETQRSARISSYEWDLRTGRLTWSSEAYRLFGVAPGSEVAYEDYLAVVVPEDRAAVREAIARAVREGTEFAIDHRYANPAGEVRDAGNPERLLGSGQDVTDRVNAERAEDAFNGVWEHAPVGIALYDAETFVCVRHNRRFLDLVGADFRRAGTVADLPLRDLFDAETYARVRAIFDMVRATGEPFAIDEFPAVLEPDPTPRYCQWSLTPVREEGRVRWLVVTAVEISALVQERLERQALLDAAVEGIFGLDAAGRCAFLNPAAGRLLGIAPGDAIGRPLEALLRPAEPDGEDPAAAIRAALGPGRPALSAEGAVRGPGGATRHVLYSVSRIPAERQTTTAAVVSLVDIGERVRAEAALRASEAGFRTLVDANVAGVVLVDAEGPVRYANDAFLRLVGYDRADLERGGLRWDDLTPPEWIEVSRAAIAEARRHGVSQTYEKEYRRRDGERVPVLAAVTRTEIDGVEQLIGIALADVERKRLERLRQDFLAMVTHDLRTPLTTLRAGGQLLRRRGEYREATAAAMLEQADRMQRLLDDLADLARLESGRLELRREPVDLADLARRQVAEAREQSPAHAIAVETPPGPVAGEWTADRLDQVLQNLIGNAIKYVPEGGAIVVRVEADAAEARLVVADDGPGIAPEHLARLFERFYRADTSGTKGLGLGLYISRMLVEAMGGRIWAESEPGRGSSFTVALPRSS